MGFVRTTEFGLAIAFFVGALTLGADPLLMSLALFGAWSFASLGLFTTPDLAFGRKMVLSGGTAALLVAYGVFLYWHSAHPAVPEPPPKPAPSVTMPTLPPIPRQMPPHLLLSLFMGNAVI
jgi:hypothetical protein